MSGNTRHWFSRLWVDVCEAFENSSYYLCLGGSRLCRIERHRAGRDGAGKMLAQWRLSVAEIRIFLSAPDQRHRPEPEHRSAIECTHDGLQLVSIQAYLNRGNPNGLKFKPRR